MNIIRFIDRILWGTHLGNLTSPANWGRCSHCDEVLPWVTNTHDGDYCCTRCGHGKSQASND